MGHRALVSRAWVFTRLTQALFTVATGMSSTFLFSRALRALPMGTGYAVWTGIGAAGTALLGMAVLGDSAALIFRQFAVKSLIVFAHR
jgi:multidrug transporter EmrE-like cation transporter